jgi:hypothetical protein
MSGQERPNIVAGNTIGALNHSGTSGNTGPFPAQGNWWGHETGPYSPWINPGGQGDEIGFAVQAEGWLTTAPDLSDSPPFVTQRVPFLLCEPGDTILVNWEVEDNGSVVSQRVLMEVSGGGIPDWVTLLSDLPGAQRSAFVDVPFIGQTADARSTILRVEATDDAGHVGVHDVTLQVPILHRPDGQVRFLTDISQGFAPASETTVCYDAVGLPEGSSGLRIFLVLETEENLLKWGPSGSPGISSCTFSPLRFPAVSTDRARFALFADGTGNDNDWYLSEPFPLRPHAAFPDAPPSVQMLTPGTGASFPGGSVVPMTWGAQDDEGLREFRIQVSLNDGRTWSTIRTLPADARSYDWALPAVPHLLDAVRVRVVAVDQRFQATTDGDAARRELYPE